MLRMLRNYNAKNIHTKILLGMHYYNNVVVHYCTTTVQLQCEESLREGGREGEGERGREGERERERCSLHLFFCESVSLRISVKRLFGTPASTLL